MKTSAWRQTLQRSLQQEDLNFLLTNRIPRIALTRFMGWFSQLRHPLLARASIAVWRLFTDLDLSDAKQQRFASLHDCFTRELREGARTVDPRPEVLSSPCDAIVGACGRVEAGQVFQAKGFPYALHDLFGPTQDTSAFEGGLFITLRLTSAMYHRFHAPADCRVEHVTHIAGDTWNVNPIALKRVERLFCRNERAVLRCRLADAQATPIALVPVAAILVASLRLHFLDLLLHVGYRGANELPCRAEFRKGQEMGWFQHGSTILVFVPPGFALCEGIATGQRLRMGQALLRRQL
ncbi:archaetidylserine decarboxylase [Paucibacter sp. DJ1R-11]|uniref:archaetidylserine decarboxylase n=1 Tax=Paucibacter sp. DJ1R-11 TaxID=2893556 RepID=UPI0021E37B7F|nr:archaetidylserine decarboxylase [Paucibacter sp. DJ1R-11]MCV2365661.1 archaetidylserine decarboxylase [Paucibacter sp. DJ1R-11]